MTESVANRAKDSKESEPPRTCATQASRETGAWRDIYAPGKATAVLSTVVEVADADAMQL